MHRKYLYGALAAVLVVASPAFAYSGLAKEYCRGITVESDGHKGCYVNSGARKPHLHIGKDFVSYKEMNNDHDEICRNDRFNINKKNDALDDLADHPNSDITNILRRINGDADC